MSANKLLLTIFLILGTWALAAGCGSDDNPVAPVEDEAPVLPVENVTAVASDVDKLVIRWDPSSHPRLRGYNVYRVEVAAQTAVLMTSNPILQTDYRDMSARRGVAYEYRVTAVTKAGKESTYTPVTVILQADMQTPPNGEESRKTSE